MPFGNATLPIIPYRITPYLDIHTARAKTKGHQKSRKTRRTKHAFQKRDLASRVHSKQRLDPAEYQTRNVAGGSMKALSRERRGWLSLEEAERRRECGVWSVKSIEE